MHSVLTVAAKDGKIGSPNSFQKVDVLLGIFYYMCLLGMPSGLSLVMVLLNYSLALSLTNLIIILTVPVSSLRGPHCALGWPISHALFRAILLSCLCTSQLQRSIIGLGFDSPTGFSA